MKRILCSILALTLLLGMVTVSGSPAASAVSANVALGKSVAFGYGSELTSSDGNYSVTAVKAGTSVLTDGVNNSPNWWVNNGNPYVALKSTVITGPYIFSVDLGAQYDAEQVRIYSYGRPDWSVYPVEQVSFTVSSDGSNWQSLGTVKLENATVNTVEDPRYEGSYVDIYCFTLDISATGRYIRATFPTNASGLVGIGEIEVYGQKVPGVISTGASVTYFGHSGETGTDANWSSAAVNSGLSVLTDGVANSPNWWVNNGNPNIGLKNAILAGPYVFNLDLGSQSTVRQISAYFYSRTDWGVDAPNTVTYSVSTDGCKWTEVGSVEKAKATTATVEDSRNPDAQSPTIYRFALDLSAVDARYVKITFSTNAAGLVGLQEIEVSGVKKAITNLALGRMANASYYDYTITGGGTGYEATGTTKADGSRYTVTEVELASASRLTDGTVINSSAATYPSNWASQKWNSGSIMGKYLQIYRNDSRIITLDLGAVRNITGIRMHFAAVEAMGFYMPTNVTYYLSEDGETFYEAADVWNYQSTADGNDSNISCSGTKPRHEWYAAQNLNYNARYVKVIFPVNVYILSDELQVYGCETLSSGAANLTACPKYDPLEKYVGHFANLEQSGGVKNEFMAYSGWYINSDGSEVYNTYKTQKEYMCAIAYVDGNGVPTDWLFDDVTVMGHYYTSSGTFNSYKAGYTSGSYYADKDDWYEWLCYAFGKDAKGNDLSYNGESVINLEALEAAAASAKETLNDPDYKVGVKLVLFPAVEYQNNWGTLNGKKIDFTVSGAGSQEAALTNRKAAYQWYVDTAVEMWEQAGFEHLELTGFYYYEETIHESTDRIAKAATQALTEIVHTHATPSTNTRPATTSAEGGKLRIYQLPFYQSEGYWNWAEYGFDYALMQPNYSFYDMYTLTQLEECGDLCEYYGLGMQMEFGGAASTAYHEKFKDYLTYGDDFGYQNAVLSWYMSTWGCINMATNSNGTRYLYDMVYDFVKTQNANLIDLCAHTAQTASGICHYCGQDLTPDDDDSNESEPDIVTIPTLTAKSFSLSFESEILVNFYYAISDVTEVVEQGMLVFYGASTAPDVTKADEIYPNSLYNETTGLYTSTTAGIAAKEMGDARYYAAYAKLSDGTYAYSPLYAYSPKKYAYNMLSRASTSEKQKALCVAMLNYGAEAQKYFSYNTDSLMNADLTDEQKAMVVPYDATLFKGAVAADAAKTVNFTKTATGFGSRSASVSFEGAFAINYYFAPGASVAGDMTLYYWTPKAYAAADVLTPDNASGSLAMTANASGTYWGQVSGIAAKNLDDTYYVAGVYTDPEGTSYCTGVIAYSLSRYCLNNAKDGNTMQELAAATAMYGYYAKAYFA